ncbi:MAG: hypothetical protein ACLRWQ_19545 [Flavonifractor plautii]
MTPTCSVPDAYRGAPPTTCAAGQLYLLDNPLLQGASAPWTHIKKKIVGHWGTVPGQNFVVCPPEPRHQRYDWT